MLHTMLIISFLVAILVAPIAIPFVRIKKKNPQITTKQNLVKSCFYSFVILQSLAILIIITMVIIAIIFFNMPLNWGEMNGFCKRAAPLSFLAYASLFIAMISIIQGLLSCILSPKKWRISTYLGTVFLAYQFQFSVVHWLVD
jgi:hypothetical protein